MFLQPLHNMEQFHETLHPLFQIVTTAQTVIRFHRKILHSKFPKNYTKSNLFIDHGGSTRRSKEQSLKVIFPSCQSEKMNPNLNVENKKAISLRNSHFDRFSKKVTKTTGKLANNSRQTWGRSKNNKFTQPQDDLWGCKEAVVNQRTDKLGFCEKNLSNFLSREKLTKK